MRKDYTNIAVPKATRDILQREAHLQEMSMSMLFQNWGKKLQSKHEKI